MAALADALANKEHGHNVYMVNSEAAETLSRRLESSSKKRFDRLTRFTKFKRFETVHQKWVGRSEGREVGG